MHQKINIIIADDQKLFRDSLISLLKEYNIHTIGGAKNGKELLKLLETLLPDIILLDVEMPVMDGSTALDILSKEKPYLKIIMLSQYDEEVLKENFLLRGAKAFLTKNTEIDIILNEIRRIHELEPADPSLLRPSIVFTKREIQIIPMICAGKSTKEISSALNLEIKTVEAYRKRLYKKTGAICIGEFLRIAFQKGLHFLKNIVICFT